MSAAHTQLMPTLDNTQPRSCQPSVCLSHANATCVFSMPVHRWWPGFSQPGHRHQTSLCQTQHMLTICPCQIMPSQPYTIPCSSQPTSCSHAQPTTVHTMSSPFLCSAQPIECPAQPVSTPLSQPHMHCLVQHTPNEAHSQPSQWAASAQISPYSA